MKENEKDENLKKIQETAEAFEESLKNGGADEFLKTLLGDSTSGSNPLGEILGGLTSGTNPLASLLGDLTTGKNPLGDILGDLSTGKNPLGEILGDLPTGKTPFGDIFGELAKNLGKDCENGECDSDCEEGTCKGTGLEGFEGIFGTLLKGLVGDATVGMPPFGNPLGNLFNEEPKTPVNGFGAVNAIDLGKKYLVEVSLPGVSKSDIKVSSYEDTLTIEISGKEGITASEDAKFILKEYSAFNIKRDILLPNIDSEGIKVKFANGELTIEAKKLEIQPIFYDVK